MRIRLAIGLVALAGLAALVWWSRRTPVAELDSAAGLDPDAAHRTGTELSELDRATNASRTTAVTSASEVADAVDLDDLLERLARIARARSAGDARALQEELEQLLVRPATVHAALRWLATPDALDAAEACQGALVLLETALALYDSGDPRFAGAGGELVHALLESLPRLDARLLRSVVDVLARARSQRGFVLDGRYLAEIVRLRRAHPELAEATDGLFQNLALALGSEEQAESFRRLFLEGQEDPLLVKLALGPLLQEAPETFLPLAEALLLAKPDDLRLRTAVLQAIAASAPVEDAVRSLARLGKSSDYAQFHVLGSRPEALEKIEDEYGSLLASQMNPEGRKMLVAAMRSQTEAVLLGIARTDPSPQVQSQALLTLTVRGPVEAGVVDELRALRPSAGQPNGVSQSNLNAAVENVLLNSKGGAQEAARDLLIEIVRDPALKDSDRLDAWRRVRKFTPSDTFFGVVIGGQPLQ